VHYSDLVADTIFSKLKKSVLKNSKLIDCNQQNKNKFILNEIYRDDVLLITKDK